MVKLLLGHHIGPIFPKEGSYEQAVGARLMIGRLDSNALAREYQAEYGTAGRNIDIADFVNNPSAPGGVRIYGPGFFEKVSDLPLVERGVLTQQIANTLLVSKD